MINYTIEEAKDVMFITREEIQSNLGSFLDTKELEGVKE